jgi:hypothetical protein
MIWRREKYISPAGNQTWDRPDRRLATVLAAAGNLERKKHIQMLVEL